MTTASEASDYSFELCEHLLNDQWPGRVPSGAAVLSSGSR
ncbi:hypothetical protein I546_2951 [Mycobacterium kansasii 732]|nr:hypothetical protein I546_2951 [Mycobacterium kansasii 732]